MKKNIRVTVYNEYVHEREDAAIGRVYPDGIHGAIAAQLGKASNLQVRIATLDLPEHGLSQEVLDQTDVLIWWGHCRHADVSDEVAQRVKERVLGGMGFIVLHSGHASKPFKLLMGTSCRVKWRCNNERERLWVVDAAHPILRGLPECIEIEQEETYGEPFGIPTPDELLLISWFRGGEVFRSGCCYRRGLGKIFYFRPGHEEYPIYYRDDIGQILRNAVEWACPEGITVPVLGEVKPLEPIAH